MASSAEQLWRQVREDEEVLGRLLGPRADAGCAERAGEVLLRAEQKIEDLRGALPADQQPALEAAAARLARHRSTRKALMERGAHARLLEGGSRESDGEARPGSQQENSQASLRAMTAARDDMANALDHIGAANSTIHKTSETIKNTSSQYDIFDMKLKDAAALLGQLKRRTEDDTKYIWYSFWFFIGVCAFIVLRRLKVFKMIYLGFSWAWWSGATVADIMQAIVTQLAAAYQAVAHALGLSDAPDGARAGEL